MKDEVPCPLCGRTKYTRVMSEHGLICRSCLADQYGQVGKKPAIKYVLGKECPDGKMHYGTLKKVAEEVGVSIERVRQVGNEMGLIPFRKIKELDNQSNDVK